MQFGKFSDACRTNQFDKNQTLNTVNMETSEEVEDIGDFKNFKFWLIRQVNDGHSKITSWSRILVEDVSRIYTLFK